MKKQELLKMFALPDAFDNFTPKENTPLIGWNGNRPIFPLLIQEIKPKLIIEVGSWYGQSAVNMGLSCNQLGLEDTSIICIDTWLGSEEHWKDPELLKLMELENGYPTFQKRFLSNIVNNKLQDKILPLPMPSQIAASYLSSFGLKAQLIYIDGSHQEKDVYEDLMAYWELLDNNSVILGDDATWDTVMNAVKAFSSEKGILFQQLDQVNWIVRK